MPHLPVMSDEHDLSRFIEAQASVIDQVCRELGDGRKRSHWMWFIFPQIKGLGYSSTAQYYAIVSLAEAKTYLEHPVLGQRLHDCTELVNRIEGRSAHQIFGSPDDLKFHSSMTLFAQADPLALKFRAALDKYFAGALDQGTIDRLA